jgi:hypothetical protein
MIIDERGLADYVLGMKSTGKPGPKRDVMRAVRGVPAGNGLALHAPHACAFRWLAGGHATQIYLKGCSAASILVVHK